MCECDGLTLNVSPGMNLSRLLPRLSPKVSWERPQPSRDPARDKCWYLMDGWLFHIYQQANKFFIVFFFPLTFCVCKVLVRPRPLVFPCASLSQQQSHDFGCLLPAPRLFSLRKTNGFVFCCSATQHICVPVLTDGAAEDKLRGIQSSTSR